MSDQPVEKTKDKPAEKAENPAAKPSLVDMSRPENRLGPAPIADAKQIVNKITFENISADLHKRDALGLTASPDGQAVVDIIRTMPLDARRQLEEQYPNNQNKQLRDELKILGENSPLYREATRLLDERPGQVDYASNFSKFRQDALEDPVKGARELRSLLSTMTRDQIAAMKFEGKQGGIDKEIDGVATISPLEKEVLKTLAKGIDGATPQDYQELTKKIVQAQEDQIKPLNGFNAQGKDKNAARFMLSTIRGTEENLSLLRDVLGANTPAAIEARKKLNDDSVFAQHYKAAFSVENIGVGKASEADSLLRRGEITPATVAKGATGPFGTNDVSSSIESSVLNASDKQRSDFAIGKQLDKSHAIAQTDDQKSALEYYRTTEEALKAKGSAREVRIWNDELEHGKRTQGFVAETLKNSKSTMSDIADAISHMSSNEAAEIKNPESHLRDALNQNLSLRLQGDRAVELANSSPGAYLLARSIQQRLETGGDPGALSDFDKLATDQINHPDEQLKRVALAEAALKQDKGTTERLQKAFDIQQGEIKNPLPGVSEQDFLKMTALYALLPQKSADQNTDRNTDMRNLLSTGQIPWTEKLKMINSGIDAQTAPIKDLKGHFEDFARLTANDRNQAMNFLQLSPEQKGILQRTIANGGKLDDVDKIRSYTQGDGTLSKDLPDLTKLTTKQIQDYADRFNSDIRNDVMSKARSEDDGAALIVANQLQPANPVQEQLDRATIAHNGGFSPADFNEKTALNNSQSLLQQYETHKGELSPELQSKLSGLAKQYADAHTQVNIDKEKEKEIELNVLNNVASMAVGPALEMAFVSATRLLEATQLTKAGKTIEQISAPADVVVPRSAPALTPAEEVAPAPRFKPQPVQQQQARATGARTPYETKAKLADEIPASQEIARGSTPTANPKSVQQEAIDKLNYLANDDPIILGSGETVKVFRVVKDKFALVNVADNPRLPPETEAELPDHNRGDFWSDQKGNVYQWDKKNEEYNFYPKLAAIFPGSDYRYADAAQPLKAAMPAIQAHQAVIRAAIENGTQIIDALKTAPIVKFMREGREAAIRPTVFNVEGRGNDCLAETAAVQRTVTEGKLVTADSLHLEPDPTVKNSLLGNPEKIQFTSEKENLNWLKKASRAKVADEGVEVYVGQSQDSLIEQLGRNSNYAYRFRYGYVEGADTEHVVFAHVSEDGKLLFYDAQSGTRIDNEEAMSFQGKFHKFE